VATVALTQVSKSFGTVRAVAGVSFTIPSGRLFTLLGPSGCGKTTILRMIAGFETPTSGRILIDDLDVTFVPPERRDVGLVFQNYALFPHLNVFENVAYGLRSKRGADRLPRARVRETVRRTLDLVRLSGYEKRRISELSGGQQQRVALARSLAVGPRILLLDEPLSNLDARLRDTMRDEIRRIQSTIGITTVYVTHDQSEALTMSDLVAVFDRGACRQIGSPQEVYDAPADEFVAGFVGDTNLLPIRFEGTDAVLEDGQRFALPGAQGALLSVRPESITLLPAAGPGPGRQSPPADAIHLQGVLVSAVFGGPFVTSTVRLGRETLRVISAHRASEPVPGAVGQAVRMSMDARDIRVLEKAAPAGVEARSG
jgi:ABC-type Fe3+/spermidine/putrescine transport system ATPase subunit